MSYLKFQTPEEEAFEVAQEIVRVQKYTHGLLHSDDFAILVRNNRQSRSFEQALSKLQIPYRMVSCQPFLSSFVKVNKVTNYVTITARRHTLL